MTTIRFERDGPSMDAARKYHQIALDCLNLAEVSRDLATQEKMIRLAELWARLANNAESQATLAETEYGDRAA
jgi:hypothetical protein